MQLQGIQYEANEAVCIEHTLSMMNNQIILLYRLNKDYFIISASDLRFS